MEPVVPYPVEKVPQVRKIKSSLDFAADALSRAQDAWSVTQAWWALKEAHGHIREALEKLTEESDDEAK